MCEFFSFNSDGEKFYYFNWEQRKELLKNNIWVSAGYIGKPIYLCTEALAAKKTYLGIM